ncbi:MAG: phoB [Bacteroidota bacterium]|jgi:CheY-like chemotaxis protein|nr:phoB [Bacteroidota bacterium]
MNYSIKSILLVDDDQDDKYFFAKALGEADSGVELRTAIDGQDALEKLQFVNPDVILLDLNMPGMNGVAFLKTIKKDKVLKDIPVIVYTDGLSVFDESEALKLGAYCVMLKAIDFQGTVKTINEILRMNFIRMSA